MEDKFGYLMKAEAEEMDRARQRIAELERENAELRRDAPAWEVSHG